jgi:glycerate kinase
MAAMRVLVAPGRFAGTLTAVQAARAVAEGWHRRAPADELELVPMGDGGPGFVDVLHATLGGRLLAVGVRGPSANSVQTVPGAVLMVDGTAYVESAQACGRQLTAEARRDVERAGTYGVGQLVGAAVDAEARRVVVGLGGAGTNDGGAGMLSALGAVADPEGALEAGPAGLADLRAVDLAPARDRLRGVRLVAAGGADNPLLGLTGTTSLFGRELGIHPDRLQAVDALLERLADATDRKVAKAKGAGAAGGLGFGLMLLGAAHAPGVGTVAEAVRLADRARLADLVLTGEGTFDFSSRAGKVTAGVAQVAAEALRPCVALAGKVLLGSREMRTMGVESAYAVADLVGEEPSLDDPAGTLAALAERVAGTWSR